MSCGRQGQHSLIVLSHYPTWHAHSRCSVSVDEMRKWNCVPCFSLQTVYFLHHGWSEGNSVTAIPLPLVALPPLLPTVGLGDVGAQEVVLVPVLDRLLQRICGCGEKVSAEITLHSWACLHPHCLRFLQQCCGAAAPALPGLDLIDSLLACGLDARAEHMWKTSQGRGGGRGEPRGVLCEPDPNPCKTQGFPRPDPARTPFPAAPTCQ